MKAYIISAMLLTTACGKDEILGDWDKKPEEKPTAIEKEEPVTGLKSLLNSFLSDCRDKYGADTSDVDKLEFIRYGDPSTEEQPQTVGVCNSWHDESGDLVRSNIVVKEMKNPVMAKALMYHELGHCVLGLEHTSQESKTIMSPSMLPSVYYSYNWESLVKDLCLKYPK
jgi:hypothetical protein